jgi:repressor LexA
MINKPNRKHEVLAYIKSYMDAKGFPPSVREIAESLGMKSTNSVHYYIQRLVADGVIERPKGLARSIIVKG